MVADYNGIPRHDGGNGANRGAKRPILTLEHIAAALCRADGFDPYGPDEDAAEPNWTLYRADALAVFREWQDNERRKYGK